MNGMSLAVIILTFNEEKHIEQTIASARQATDEIVVVDSGSVDKTVEIAQANGAKVFHRAWDNDFAAQRNFGTAQAAADFVFHLDADERLSPELAAAVKEAASNNERKIFSCYRKNFVFGHLCKYGEMKPDVVQRLYPRGGARWEEKLHERLSGSLPRAMLKGALYHYTYEDWELFLNKVNKYTTIWARDAKAKGKRTSLAAAVGHGFFAFFKGFFLKLGFLGGLPILVTSLMHALYTMLKYLKLLQTQDKK
jgi:glycosyltransferase involved in cell wall biosynthesis